MSVRVCPTFIFLLNPSNGHLGSYLTGKENEAQRAELRVLVTLPRFPCDDVSMLRPPEGQS